MEDIVVSVHYVEADKQWISDYNGIRCPGKTFPEAVDAMVRCLTEAEATSIAAGVMPPPDVAAFCEAHRTRRVSIVWKITKMVKAETAIDFVSLDFDIDEVN